MGRGRPRRAIDYRHLKSVAQISAEAPALTRSVLNRWMFQRQINGLEIAVIEIDGNCYIDELAFAVWLYQGKGFVGDYRQLRTVRQLLAESALLESKLRHWLKYRQVNGLQDGVIVKTLGQYGKLFIDVGFFNDWLMRQNLNPSYRPPHRPEI